MATKTPPLLRTSERNDFKRCIWLWQQSWERGLTPRREPTWAWFGTAIHAGLEARYPTGRKRGKVGDMIDAYLASCNDEVRRIYTKDAPDEEEVHDATELGKEMLLGYVEKFGNDQTWEVIHSEQSFQIDVPSPDGDTLVVYAGTWDLLVWDLHSKEYWLVDHKTRKSFPSNWEFYSINEQAGSYLWVAPEVLKHLGIFKGDEVIEGIIFNCLRKAGKTAKQKAGQVDAQGRVLNNDGSVSKVQPAPRYHREAIHRSIEERVKQAERVQAEALHMQAVRNGSLPAYKTPTEDCIRCKMFEYCAIDEWSQEEGEAYARQMLVNRDPYRSHREEMDQGGVAV